MGWNAKFAIYFPEQRDPIDRFMDLARRNFNNQTYHCCYKVVVYEESAMSPILERVEDVAPNGLTFDQIDQVTQPYHGPQFGILSSWVNSRDGAVPPHCVPDIEEYESELTIMGTEFINVPWTSKLRAHAVLDAGNSKRLAPHICVERVQRNIHFVLDELASLIHAGAIIVRGLDADNSVDPREHYLCYHHEPDRYRTDLHTIFPDALNLRPVTREDLLTAADRSGRIDICNTFAQPIIYHESFTRGVLYRFYEKLLEIVTPLLSK